MLMPGPRKLTEEEETLIARLRRSAGKPLTKQEVEAQRISWVFGNLPTSSKLTRDDVVKLIKARDGE